MVTQRDKYEIDFSQVIRGAATAAVGLVALRTAFVDSVRVAIESEQADAKVAQALRARGQLTERNIELLRSQADAVMQASVFDDDYTKGLQAQALALDVNVERTDDVVRAALGLSRALGIDAEAAIKKVISAQGNHKLALKGVTVELDTNRDAIDQILEKYGSFIGSMGTTADKAAMLKNQVEELQEAFGGLILDVADSVFPFDELTEALKGLNAAASEGRFAELMVKSMFGVEMATNDVVDQMQAVEAEIQKMESARAAASANLSKSLSSVSGAVEVGTPSSVLRANIESATQRIGELREELAKLQKQIDSRNVLNRPFFERWPAGTAPGGKPDKPGKPAAAAKPLADDAWLLLVEQQQIGLDERLGMDERFYAAEQELAAANLAFFESIDALELELAITQSDNLIDLAEKSARHLKGIAKDTADTQASYSDGFADAFADNWKASVGVVGDGVASMVGAIAAGAASGEKEWAKMVGSQLMANGLQWLISAPVHAALSLIPGNQAMLPAAAAEFAQGALAMTIGAGMGGSLAGGGRSGSSGGGRGGSGRSAMHSTPRAQAPIPGDGGKTVQIIYLQSGVMVRERDAMKEVRNAEHAFALGNRHSMKPRSPY